MKTKHIHFPAAFLAFAVSCLPLVCHSEEGSPIVDHYTARNTGSTDSSWVTVQDSHGVLYFGCEQVLSFDGERWHKYAVPGSNEVHGLAFGSDGRLWVAAVNEVGFFDKNQLGLSAYHSLVKFLPENERNLGNVWKVVAHGDGAVFVTADSVLDWDGKSFRTYPMPGTRRLLAIQANGTIYIGHKPTGIWSLDDSGLKKIISSEKLRDSAVIWMEKDAAGWLLGTTDGLLRFDGEKVYRLLPEASDFIRRNELISACRLPHGDICLGTFAGGIAVVDPSGRIKQVISTENGLLSRGVYSLFVAQDGSLWVTSAAGIDRIAIDSGSSVFNSALGLTGKRIYSITQSGSKILVATEEGVFGLPLGGNAPARFEAIPGLTGRYLDLQEGPDGSTYASGFKRVDLIRDNKATEIFASKADIYLIRRSRVDPESFILADGFAIERMKKNATGEMEVAVLARVPELARSMVEDGSGNIWVGTNSRGAFLIHARADSQAAPLSLTSAKDAAGSGPGEVAGIGNAVAVFSSKGVGMYSPDGGTPVPIEGHT